MPAVEIKFEDIYFDPKVHTMCNSSNFTCPFYNHSHSCPPVAPYLQEQISRFKKYFLIYSVFDLESQVKKMKVNHPKRSEYQINLELQMEYTLKEDLEKEFEKFLEEYKDDHIEKLLLYAGTCRICFNEKDKKCTFDDGIPCRYPNRMRYSMEAIGIEVIRTVIDLNLDIEYPSNKKSYRFGLACFK